MRNGLYGICLLAAVLVGFYLWDVPPKAPPAGYDDKAARSTVTPDGS